MREEPLSLSPDEPGRPRVPLRDAADLHRVRIHLLTHWKLPRVEFRMDGLPAVESQRAQDRFVRLSEACNCLLGELLAGTTLLGGFFMTWTSMRSWRAMVLVLVATLYAALIGKGIELAWTRVKLLLVLRRLRRRLAGDFVEAAPVRAVVLPAAGKPFGHALNAEDPDVARDNRMQRPSAPARRKQPKVLLHNAADINRLIPRLATRWALPRIEIHVDGLAPLDVQRAQTRIVRLSGHCSYMPAAVLATMVLLVGLLYAVWTRSQDWLRTDGESWWVLKLDWNAVQPAVLATLCAGLIGVAIELAWMRVRLLLVLRGLRRRLRTA